MKAILEFNLPEDQEEYNTITKANALFSVIWEHKQSLRSMVKHGYVDNREMTAEEFKIAEKIYDDLHDLISNHDVNNLFY